MQKKKIIILTVTIIAILILLVLSINIIKQQDKNELNLSENVAREETIIEPNVPVISAGMIPIKQNGEQWIITTQDDINWYDYKEGNPAYIMLNDGYYKSEPERGIDENQLMQNSVGGRRPRRPANPWLNLHVDTTFCANRKWRKHKVHKRNRKCRRWMDNTRDIRI